MPWTKKKLARLEEEKRRDKERAAERLRRAEEYRAELLQRQRASKEKFAVAEQRKVLTLPPRPADRRTVPHTASAPRIADRMIDVTTQNYMPQAEPWTPTYWSPVDASPSSSEPHTPSPASSDSHCSPSPSSDTSSSSSDCGGSSGGDW